MRKRTLAYTLSFIAAGIIIGIFIAGSLKHETLTLADKAPLPASSTELLNSLSDSLSEVAAATMPSVVSISSTQTVEMHNSGLDQ
ncbi:MAG: hypothetical protein P8130_05295 [Deltaproteobacteria bacterium]